MTFYLLQRQTPDQLALVDSTNAVYCIWTTDPDQLAEQGLTEAQVRKVASETVGILNHLANISNEDN